MSRPMWIGVVRTILCFLEYIFDPVEGVGIRLGGERRNPIVWVVRFRDVLKPELYARLRWNFFRMHFQFIMANDRRGPYDYFMMTCGPAPSADWATRGLELVARFSENAAYNPMCR